MNKISYTKLSKHNYHPIDTQLNYERQIRRSRFFCNGRIYISPSYKFGVGTILYTIAYSVIYIVYVAMRMSSYTISLVIIELFLLILTLAFCLLCMMTDPAILPRQLLSPAELMNKNFTQPNRSYYIKGYKYKVKICKTCFILRGPGISHCKKCKACIERFDHHCPWVGNCIGKNNYKYFFTYIAMFNLLVWKNLSVSIFLLVHFPEYVKAMCIVEIILSVITGIFVITLFLYHSLFVCKNITTYANLKMTEIFHMFGNPFTRRDWKKNCYQVFCIKYYTRIDDFQGSERSIRNEKNFDLEKSVKVITYEKSKLTKVDQPSFAGTIEIYKSKLDEIYSKRRKSSKIINNNH